MKTIIIQPGLNIIFDPLWVIARKIKHRITKTGFSQYKENIEDEIKPVENEELFDHLFIP